MHCHQSSDCLAVPRGSFATAPVRVIFELEKTKGEEAAEVVMAMEDTQEVVEGQQKHKVPTKDSKGATPDLTIMLSSQSRISPALLLLL